MKFSAMVDFLGVNTYQTKDKSRSFQKVKLGAQYENIEVLKPDNLDLSRFTVGQQIMAHVEVYQGKVGMSCVLAEAIPV